MLTTRRLCARILRANCSLRIATSRTCTTAWPPTERTARSQRTQHTNAPRGSPMHMLRVSAVLPMASRLLIAAGEPVGERPHGSQGRGSRSAHVAVADETRCMRARVTLGYRLVFQRRRTVCLPPPPLLLGPAAQAVGLVEPRSHQIPCFHPGAGHMCPPMQSQRRHGCLLHKACTQHTAPTSN